MGFRKRYGALVRQRKSGLPSESEIASPPQRKPRRIARASKLGENFINIPEQLGAKVVTEPKLADGAAVARTLGESSQGFGSDLVFSATDFDTVAWGAGTITLADGTAFSIVAGNTGNMTLFTYIYLDPAVSTTVLQTTTSAATATGERKVLIAVAQKAPASDQSAFYVAAVGTLGVNQDNLSANSVTTIHLQANSVTSVEINVVTLDAISANLGTVTAGVLRDSASKFKIDLDNRLITMIDEQGTPQTRIRLGELGPAAADWGLEIFDSAGATILSATGLGVDTVGNLQVKDQDLEWKRLVVSLASTSYWALPGRWIRFGLRSAVTTASNTFSVPDGDLHVVPWTPAANDTILDLALEVTATGTGNVRIVVYEDNGSFYPGALLYESANIDISTTGIKTIVGANVVVSSGQVYWIGWLTDTTANPTMRAWGNTFATDMAPLFGASSEFTGTTGSSLLKTGQAFPAPDPFPSGAVPPTSGGSPGIVGKL